MLQKLQKLKQRKAQSEGFTIIEVLIVLAIAGLILLIVFLAVPALERNSRNTQRKEDVSNLLAAVSEYVSNNSGTLPAAVVVGTNQATFCDASPCGTTVSQAVAKIGYYGSGSVSLGSYGSLSIPTAATDKVYIATGATCNGNSIASSTSSRSVAATYAIETGSGLSWQCQAS